MGERHPDFGHDCIFFHHHLLGTNGFNDHCKCHLCAALIFSNLILSTGFGIGSGNQWWFWPLRPHLPFTTSVTSPLFGDNQRGVGMGQWCVVKDISSFKNLILFFQPFDLTVIPAVTLCDSRFCFWFS